ncbi:unnamed protein product, partial [Symbiodinium sp. CCMP2456]
RWLGQQVVDRGGEEILGQGRDRDHDRALPGHGSAPSSSRRSTQCEPNRKRLHHVLPDTRNVVDGVRDAQNNGGLANHQDQQPGEAHPVPEGHPSEPVHDGVASKAGILHSIRGGPEAGSGTHDHQRGRHRPLLAVQQDCYEAGDQGGSGPKCRWR